MNKNNIKNKKNNNYIIKKYKINNNKNNMLTNLYEIETFLNSFVNATNIFHIFKNIRKNSNL